jgi:hypothetical protein
VSIDVDSPPLSRPVTYTSTYTVEFFTLFRVRSVYICYELKGSLTRDFQLQAFFMNLFPPGPCYFKLLRKFAEIFENKV